MGEDFVSVLEADLQAEFDLRKSAYSEFRAIHAIADERRRASAGRRFMKRAVEDLPLIDQIWTDGSRAIVRALSPSHEAVTRSQKKLAAVTAMAGKPRKPFRGDPNECSVALWIQTLDKSILLGADLLKGPSGCGWAGILTDFKPTERASLFKVSHHGAPNADEPEIWKQLLVEKDPVALLAPYRGGSRARPDKTDGTRILARTSRAYITASPAAPAIQGITKREKANLGHRAINARDPWGSIGQVRARSHRTESEWQVDLTSPARELKDAVYQRRRRK